MARIALVINCIIFLILIVLMFPVNINIPVGPQFVYLLLSILIWGTIGYFIIILSRKRLIPYYLFVIPTLSIIVLVSILLYINLHPRECINSCFFCPNIEIVRFFIPLGLIFIQGILGYLIFVLYERYSLFLYSFMISILLVIILTVLSLYIYFSQFPSWRVAPITGIVAIGTAMIFLLILARNNLSFTAVIKKRYKIFIAVFLLIFVLIWYAIVDAPIEGNWIFHRGCKMGAPHVEFYNFKDGKIIHYGYYAHREWRGGKWYPKGVKRYIIPEQIGEYKKVGIGKYVFYAFGPAVWHPFKIKPDLFSFSTPIRQRRSLDLVRDARIIKESEAAWPMERRVSTLIEKIQNESDCYKRREAARSLSKLGKYVKKAISILENALNDKDDSIRLNAAEALVILGDKKRVEIIIQILKNKEGDIRRSAADALGYIGDKQAVEPLIQALNDEDKDVRSSAASALGSIGSRQAVRSLIQALKDKNKDVRNSAALALGKIGDRRAVEPLIQVLKDKNEYKYILWNAAEVLGEIGDKRAVEPLMEALKDAYEYVRRNAALALGEIGDRRAVESLIQTLKNENEHEYVRISAARALGEIGDKRAIEPLTPFLSDKYEYTHDKYGDVQQAVKKAIEKIKKRNP